MTLYLNCEHCKEEAIYTWPDGSISRGRYKPLCDDCEKAHEEAQGVHCRTCGRALDEIDAPYLLCGVHQRWAESDINPHTWKPEPKDWTAGGE